MERPHFRFGFHSAAWAVALGGALAFMGCSQSHSVGGGLHDGAVQDAGGGSSDAGGGSGDAGRDAGPQRDAGYTCSYNSPGTCPASGNLSCECCPYAGPTQHCLCSTPCNSDSDCTDPARPHCNKPAPPGTGPGFCTPTTFQCCWLCL